MNASVLCFFKTSLRHHDKVRPLAPSLDSKNIHNRVIVGFQPLRTIAYSI